MRQFPATARPSPPSQVPTLQAATNQSDIAPVVSLTNLSDFGRWPSEDKVHERAEEGRSEDIEAGYNTEIAWKRTIGILGFEAFKEDLAALLEVYFLSLYPKCTV